MKFFPFALLLLLTFNGLKGSTLPQERPDDGFNTAILTNLSGRYEAKSSCDNVDTTSFSASHEYQFNSGEENSCDFGHKFACIITNFLKSVTNLAGCDRERNGTLTVHLNTGVSQTEDGENCTKVQKCVLPTLTIKATDCKAPCHSICGKCDQSKNLKEKDGQGDSTKEQNGERAKEKQKCFKNRKSSSKCSFSTSPENSGFSPESRGVPFQSVTKIGELEGFGSTGTTPEQTKTNIKSEQKHGKPTTSFIKPTVQSFSSSSDQSTLFSDDDIFLPVSVTRQPVQDPNLTINKNSFSDSYFTTEEETKTNEEINSYGRQILNTNEVPQMTQFQEGINSVPQVFEPFESLGFVERQNELNRFEGGRLTTPLFEKERLQIIQPEVYIPLENSFENKHEFIGSSSQQTEISSSGISSETSSTSYAQAETNIKSEVQKGSANSSVNEGNQCPCTRQLQNQITDPADVCSQQQTSTATLSESGYQVKENIASDNPIFNDSPNKKSDEGISEQWEETETQVPQPQPSLDNSNCSDQLSTNERELTSSPKGPKTSKIFEESEQNFQPPVNHPPSPSLSLKTQTFTTETLGITEAGNDYPPQEQIHPTLITSSSTHLGTKSTSSPLVQVYPESFDTRNPAINRQSEGQLTGPLIPPNNQISNFPPGFGLTSLAVPKQNQTSFEGKEIPVDRTESASIPSVQRPLMDYSQKHSDEQFPNSRIRSFLKPNDFYQGHQPTYYPPEGYSSQGHFENYMYNNYPRFDPQSPRPGFSQTPYFPGENIKHFPPYSEHNRFDPQHSSPNQFQSRNQGLEGIQRYPYREQFFDNGNRYLPNARPDIRYNPLTTPGMVAEYPPLSHPYQNNFRPFQNEPEYLMRERGIQFRPYELQKAQLENKYPNTPILTPSYGPNSESVPFYPRNNNIDRFGNNHSFKSDFHPAQVPDNQKMPPFRKLQGQYPYFGHFLNDSDHRVDDQYRRPSPFYPPSHPNKELNKAEIPNTVRNQEVFEALNDYRKAQSDLSPSERLSEFGEKGITQTSNQNEPYEQLQNSAYSSRNQNPPGPNFELNRHAPGQMPNEEFRLSGVQKMEAQQQENSVFGRPERQLNISPPDSSPAQFRDPFPQQRPSIPNFSNEEEALRNFLAQNPELPDPNFINTQNPELPDPNFINTQNPELPDPNFINTQNPELPDPNFINTQNPERNLNSPLNNPPEINED